MPCTKAFALFSLLPNNNPDIVYEGESEYFFHDSRHKIMQDDDLARLISFYNVFVRYEVLIFVWSSMKLSIEKH
jgi:hypothetical protein